MEDVNILVFFKVVPKHGIPMDEELWLHRQPCRPKTVPEVMLPDRDMRGALEENLAQFAVWLWTPLGIAEAGIPDGSCQDCEIAVQDVARRVNEVCPGTLDCVGNATQRLAVVLANTVPTFVNEVPEAVGPLALRLDELSQHIRVLSGGHDVVVIEVCHIVCIDEERQAPINAVTIPPAIPNVLGEHKLDHGVLALEL
ncbi:hypothetical protein ATCV1_z122L [Acanthocystis turfacea chlorella virus 1]|uniref:Uncharacterized protein z122L n=1 Tax=Chlorovirus heliozoae TaxID=322019 RepID=A7K882_9PHYC|nr:hypothetical protein ATCV1_z122L [Acanthocystis turfacea chlorella virus 1]ABT16256.1 hypothetical protein ATCV1_z122L [Acanthocystis turfacea chlorella virus 1]